MNSFYRFCTCALVLFSALAAKSQTLEFVENKGQWDSQVRYKSDLGGSAFFLQKKGYKVLLNNKDDLRAIAYAYSGHDHDKKISETSHNLSSPGPEGKVTLHSHAYEVNFIGASDNPNIIPDKPINTFNNYFRGTDQSKWAADCKIYRAVVYENIYPGIDVRYYTDRGNLKYDLIVHPGADPGKIALRFDGTQGISVKNSNLVVKTSLGDVTEMKPYCYELNEKGKTDVTAKFVVEGNTVKFKLDAYTKGATIVIDPVLVFASFTYSQSDNWGYTATYDGSGNFYAGGISFGTGYPVSTGAFQTVFGGGTNEGQLGGYDCAIIKLSSDGSQRMYGTYLGGSSNEQPHSLVVDNQGNLIIAGRTNSTDFPSTLPTVGTGGGFDIFITKLSIDGRAILASRKIGGISDDGVNIRSKEIPGPLSISRNYGDDARSEVIVDNNNSIYLVSCTQSKDFPVTANAFQPNFGGAQDGVVMKANANLSNFDFISFLGGSNNDAAFSLSLNPGNNNIYVGGATASSNLPGIGVNNGPVIYSAYRGGESDGFISIIGNTGASPSLIKSCYVGTSGNDMLYGVQFDRFGFPYVMGTTTVAFPVINAPFNASEQAAGKQYITKLQPDLSGVVYSANFGKGLGAPDISPTAFLVDRCENVYVAGWGGGINAGEGYPNANTSGLKTTADAIRPNSDGSDFYFFILEKNALSQLYGTFYGNIDNVPDVGDHVDGGTSRFDKEGIIYEALCANCGVIGNFPTTPGVWGPDNPAQTGAQCNEAMLKIAFEFAGVGAGLQSAINGVPRDTSGCLPLTVDFRDTIANGKKFIWHFGDGSPDVTTDIPSTQHIFSSLGNFRVRLISIDSLTCNIADTAFLTIRVRDDKADISFTSLKLQPCDSLKYQFTNTSVAPVTKPFGPASFEWSFGDGTTLISNAPTVVHSFPASGTYNVALRLVDTGYCNSPDSATLQLRIAANVKAQFETPAAGCAPYAAVFNNTSLAGQQFFWDFGDGTTSTDVNPVHTYNFVDTYTIKLIVVDQQTCNITDSTQQTIIVSAKPTAGFTFGPKPPQENTPTEFTNFSFGANLYKWTFGDGDSLITANRDTLIKHIYNTTGTFNVCLVAFNQFGCTDTLCQVVQSIIVPLIDVPNAFTPNGDGVNDKVTVKGYGIQKMDWRIYNRWGALVFQSNSPTVGWDGMYKGTLQPQEVYVYVLDVTFSDGTNYRKKGDITLLR